MWRGSPPLVEVESKVPVGPVRRPIVQLFVVTVVAGVLAVAADPIHKPFTVDVKQLQLAQRLRYFSRRHHLVDGSGEHEPAAT